LAWAGGIYSCRFFCGISFANLLATMSRKNLFCNAMPGITAILFLLSACTTTFHTKKEPCGALNKASDVGLPGDSTAVFFGRHQIPFKDVMFVKVDVKNRAALSTRYYIRAQIRTGKTYTFFTEDQSQAEKIYSLLSCKAKL
jgi:hypothetical protein